MMKLSASIRSSLGESISQMRIPDPLPSNSIHPKIGRLLSLVAAGFTLIVALIHLCTIGVKLSFPSGESSFSSDYNRDSYRLALFSFTPNTLFDCWTPLAFAFIGAAIHIQSLKINAISSGFLRYSIFHFCMIMFGNFPYAGGIGIIFGILNMLMMPYFLGLGILSPYEEVSMNIQINFGEEDNTINASTGGKFSSGTHPLPTLKGFPVVSYDNVTTDYHGNHSNDNMDNYTIEDSVDHMYTAKNLSESNHMYDSFSMKNGNGDLSEISRGMHQNFYVKNHSTREHEYPSNQSGHNQSTVIEVDNVPAKPSGEKPAVAEAGDANRRPSAQILIC